MVTPKASTKERDGVYACSWEKLKGKTPMSFTDGVQVVLSKCIRRTDQDWSKYLPIHKSFNAFFAGVSNQLWRQVFFSKSQGKCDTCVGKIERIGDEFNFLRRKCKLEVDGSWIQPGNYIQQVLKAYEDQIGPVKLQQLPADNSIQMEDKSALEQEKISLFRSIVGPGIYLCQKRYDVAFTVKAFKNGKSNCHFIT